MGKEQSFPPDFPDHLKKPIAYDADWTQADYVREIHRRVREVLRYYGAEPLLDEEQSADDLFAVLCRVVLDWVPGLQIEEEPDPSMSYASFADLVFGDERLGKEAGVSQPVSENLDRALRQYRDMDAPAQRKVSLMDAIERSVRIDGLAVSSGNSGRKR